MGHVRRRAWPFRALLAVMLVAPTDGMYGFGFEQR